MESWCPIEVDQLPLGRKRALMVRAQDYTVFVKNSIAFPYFGDEYVRNNLISNNGRPCFYTKDNPDEGCQIFKLGEMVDMAGGNFSRFFFTGESLAGKICFTSAPFFHSYAQGVGKRRGEGGVGEGAILSKVHHIRTAHE